jgi:hypothetical protein
MFSSSEIDIYAHDAIYHKEARIIKILLVRDIFLNLHTTSLPYTHYNTFFFLLWHVEINGETQLFGFVIYL